MLPISVDQGLGVLVWSPLAAGLLSGKHRRTHPVAEGSRQAAGWTEPPIRDQDRLWDIVDVLVSVGEKHGVEAVQIALAWLLTRPAVSSLVVGGSNEQQFINNFRALDVKLDQDDLDRLDRVSQPPLIYPYWHQNQFARDRFSAGDWALHSRAE